MTFRKSDGWAKQNPKQSCNDSRNLGAGVDGDVESDGIGCLNWSFTTPTLEQIPVHAWLLGQARSAVNRANSVLVAASGVAQDCGRPRTRKRKTTPIGNILSQRSACAASLDVCRHKGSCVGSRRYPHLPLKFESPLGLSFGGSVSAPLPTQPAMSLHHHQ